MQVDNRLFAPEQYWTASQEVRDQVVNGCGTAGWKGRLVPDSIWGLCITPACNIHDWMYTTGTTPEDKDAADRTFLNNMLRLIDSAEGFWAKLLRGPRSRAAYAYYEAVHVFGGPAFWSGKNPEAALCAA